MSQTEIILGQIKAKANMDTLVQNYPWESLNAQDRETLIKTAEGLASDPVGYDLLMFLFRVSSKKDEFYPLRVLDLATLRPNQETEKKTSTLKNMRLRLDTIRDSLNKLTPDKNRVTTYQFYDAEYNMLYGLTLYQDGDGQKALPYLQTALEGFKKVKSETRVKFTEGLIVQINNTPKGGPIASPAVLENRFGELTRQITDKESQLANLQQVENSTQNRLSLLSNDLNTRQAQISELTEKISKYDKKKQQIETELLELESRVQQNKKLATQSTDGLQFLLALPKMAMAPLWVESVRLALQSGKIDALTEQCVRKLAAVHPKEGLQLLAEIEARFPETYAVDAALFEMTANQWMVLLAEARVLLDKDITQAAKKAVQAWDLFFSLQKSAKNG